jgi:acetate kinase/propionate kinase
MAWMPSWFTGGIGENSPYIRLRIAKNFTYLRISVNVESNEENKKIFSANSSPVALMTIPANEEKVIAQQTYQLLKEQKALHS